MGDKVTVDLELESGLFLRNLHKDFVLLDQAKFEARPLLNCVIAALQIANFRVKAGIALLQLLIDFPLRLQLSVDIPDAKPAALAQPQRILQQGDQGSQHQDMPTHATDLFAQVVEGLKTRVVHRIAEILFDAQQLVVLGDAVGTGQ